MRQLGIEFNERLIPFTDGGSWQQFRNFSPTGLVPCLTDDDITIWESLAIFEFLAEQHPSVWPADPRARAWARSAAAEIHAGFTAIRNRCPMTVGLTIDLYEQHEDLEADLVRLNELWIQGLESFGGPFLAGDQFSGVDAFFCPVAFRINSYGLALQPQAREYAECLLQLPQMRRWHDDGCAEVWREASHEKEILALGRVLEDRRKTPPAG